MHNLIYKYEHWRFKNTSLLIISLILFFYFADAPFIKDTINHIGNLGYFGAFIVGIFFVSTFTVAPAGVVLFYLAKELAPIELALAAGSGAVLGDYIIFRFLKDGVFEELKPIFSQLESPRLSHLLATPFFGWLAPVIGAILIATPLPNEIGVGLLGIAKLKNWQFIALSFVLNAISILLVITIAKSF